MVNTENLSGAPRDSEGDIIIAQVQLECLAEVMLLLKLLPYQTSILGLQYHHGVTE